MLLVSHVCAAIIVDMSKIDISFFLNNDLFSQLIKM